MAKEKAFSGAGVATAAAAVVAAIVLTLGAARFIRWAILRPLRALQEASNDVVLSDAARAAADHNDLVVAHWIAFAILVIGLIIFICVKFGDFLTG